MGSGHPITIGSNEDKSYEIGLIPRSVISGKVLDDEGEPVMSARVMAISKLWITGKSHNVVVRSAETNDLGEFRLSNLAPGAYALFTQGPIEYQSLNTPQREQFMPVFYPGVQELGQSTPIDVQANQDVSGVIAQLKKGPRFHIRGKITIEGSSSDGSTTSQISKLNLTLVAADELVAPAFKAKFLGNGSFEFPGGVIPGRYFLHANAMPGTYLKSVKSGSSELLGTEINLLNGGALILDLTYRSGTSRISGTIESAASTAGGPSLAHVLVIPVSSINEEVKPSFGKVDEANKFTTGDLAPGRYSVVALEKVDYLAIQNPAKLQAIRSLGYSVDVGENQAPDVRLKLISSVEEAVVLHPSSSQ